MDFKNPRHLHFNILPAKRLHTVDCGLRVVCSVEKIFWVL